MGYVLRIVEDQADREYQDPCIYDSEGVLLVLQQWRACGQARWVPLLDTSRLDRLAGGRKEETYWPVALAEDKFYCIILKGGDSHPFFPRPLLTDFPLEVPVLPEERTSDNSSDQTEVRRLQENFVRASVLLSLQSDLAASISSSHAQRAELAQQALGIDKVLLQMLAAACVEGEDAGMKGLEIVSLMHDKTGRMLDAAAKVAARFKLDILAEKIGELAERRLVGLDEDEQA